MGVLVSLFKRVMFNWSGLRHRMKIDFKIVIAQIMRSSIKCIHTEQSKIFYDKIVIIYETNANKFCIY